MTQTVDGRVASLGLLAAANGHAVSAAGRRGIKADGSVRFGVEDVMGTTRNAD